MLRTLYFANGTQRQVHLGGWRKQLTDPRDETYRIKLHPAFLGSAPTTVDLRPTCSPIRDQGSLGSCTAFMRSALVEYNEHAAAAKLTATPAAQVVVSSVQTAATGVISFSCAVTPAVAPPTPTPVPVPTPTPSPVVKLVQDSCLFGYYSTRRIEGTTTEDAGGTIRDAVKGGVTYGCVGETVYPYDATKFAVNPPASVWTTAATHKVTSYHAITDGDVATMKSVLATGSPIGFGFQVYDAMLSAQVASSGLLCRPKPTESLQGGHAVCLVGFDSAKLMPDGSKGAFLVRNSWGTGWALNGYFWMAENYISDTSLCSDFWVIQSAPL